MDVINPFFTPVNTDMNQRHRLYVQLLVLVTALLFGIWVYSSENLRQQQSHDHQQRIADSLAGRLSTSIHNSTLSLYSLGELALQNDGHIDQLAPLVSSMRATNPSILNIAILPDGIVRQIEPFDEHGSAIGHDMFRDPNRVADAKLAQETGKLTVTGPYPLIQGGHGVIARLPLQQNGEFWGFVSIVYAFPELIEAMIAPYMQDHDLFFQLLPSTTAAPIISNTDTLPEVFVQARIELPNNQWLLRLAFIPKFNWILLLKLVLLTISLPLAGLVYKRLLLSFTQQKHLKIALARNSQLIERQAKQQRLLAHVCHDLRAPLQYVLNEVKRFAHIDSEAVASAQTIEQSVQYQLGLIDQLLAYSASDDRDLSCRPTPGYTYSFLHELCQQARFLAQSRHNCLKVEITDDLPSVLQADFRQLQQVLINLLSNAAKFTHQGEITLGVCRLPEQTPQQHRLRFYVRDNGPGMPAPEQRGRHENSGYGLGLMIVTDLLRLMGSQLEYASSPAGGAEFFFDLELATPDAMPEPFIESHLPDWDAEGPNILLVDSDDFARESLAELLMGYGADVYGCTSLADAIRQLDQHPIDVVITELTLTDANGQDLLERVQRRANPVPVVLYSARPAQGNEHSIDVPRFGAELLKPATSEQLIRSIRHLLEDTPET